jgi:hypothetical protein
MRFGTVLVSFVAVMASGGCGPSDDERLAALEQRTSQGAQDTAQLKGANDGLVATAKAYTDGAVAGAVAGMNASVQDEARRAQAAEAAEAAARMAGDKAIMDAAKAYTDQHAVAASETHLFAAGLGPMGKDLDLGRHHGLAFTAAVVSGKKVDVYRDGTLWIYFDGACANNKPTGNPFLSSPPRMLGGDRYVADGKLYRITSSTPTSRVSVASRVSALKPCENIGGAFDMIPAAATGDSGTAYDPLSLYVDDVVVSP